MAIGSLAIVVLLHVPYVRRAGVWPFGEYQLFGAIADTFVPLLDAIGDLVEAGAMPRLTLALSPVAAEQLADPILRTGFEEYMLRRLKQAEDDAGGNDSALAEAARLQHRRDSQVLDSFYQRHGRDLVRAVRELERAGAVEAIGFPATGAVLPLLPRVSAKRGQVAAGLRAAELHLEHSTTGFWLPGGAIAPGAEGESIADLLGAHGVEYALVGERATRGMLPGMPAGGPGRSPLDVHRTSGGMAVLVRHDAFHAATVGGAGFPSHPANLCPPDTLGRRYWCRGSMVLRRISAQPVSGGDVEITVGPAPQAGVARYYRPDEAEGVLREQARTAIEQAAGLLATHKERSGHNGVLVLALDGRRFASWTEGPALLAQVVRQAREAKIKLETGAEAIHRHDIQALPDLMASSWEGEGDFRTWQADNTTWYWDVVASVLDHAESLADRFGGAINPVMVRLLAQATREALLLVSGEWAQMLGCGGEERDYAAERVRSHHDRFRRLAYMLDTANPDELDVPLLERYEALDNPFGSIELRLLSSDQPAPAGDSGTSLGPWSGMGPGGII